MEKALKYLRKTMIRQFLLATLILIGISAAGADFAFGTKVLPTDSDIGRPLFGMPAGTLVGYWDTGTFGYDQNDTVYLHVAYRRGNTICSNDIRLTDLGSLPAGSKVTSLDPDMDKTLTLLPSTINYMNLYGSEVYDLDDPVYLHQTLSKYNHKEGGDQIADEEGHANAEQMADKDIHIGFKERLPYRGDSNPFTRTNCIIFTDNYKMMIPDQIIGNIPEIVGEFRGLEIEIVHGIKNDYYHVLNTWLVKIAPHNIRHTECFVEEDEKWKEEIHPREHFIRTGDIRLSSIEGHPAGTRVLDFDPDQSRIISLPVMECFPTKGQQSSNIGYFDINGNGIYDYYDDVYLNFPSGESKGIVGVNNVRLSWTTT
jgi:hypothetical protein